MLSEAGSGTVRMRSSSTTFVVPQIQH